MSKLERGKRAQIGIYDDAWIHGDDGIEFIVPSPHLINDTMSEEWRNKIIDKLNSIGCTSFMISSEQLQESLKECERL